MLMAQPDVRCVVVRLCMTDPDPSLEEILDAVGVGVASLSPSGGVRFANRVFRRLLERLPSGHLPIVQQAKADQALVQRMAFEPSVGWLTWVAKPSTTGYSLEVYSSSESELQMARHASDAGTDPYSGIPNRRALMVELEILLTRAQPFAMLLAEPASPPGQLKLDLPVADLILRRIVAVVEGRSSARLFRVSPHGFAAIVEGGDPMARRLTLESVLSLAKQASITPPQAPDGLDFIAGAVTDADARTAVSLYLQASCALQAERAAGTMGWQWRISPGS